MAALVYYGFRMTSDDVLYDCLPLYHSAGKTTTGCGLKLQYATFLHVRKSICSCSLQSVKLFIMFILMDFLATNKKSGVDAHLCFLNGSFLAHVVPVFLTSSADRKWCTNKGLFKISEMPSSDK